MRDDELAASGVNSPAAPVEFQHKAFLSYNQKADGVLAKALETALEQFSKKWHQRRAFDVFRDATSLRANSGLWTSLTEALDRTEFFILLASPESAASPWVGEELKYWLANRDRDKLIIASTSGRIAWDRRTNDFDWTTTDALDRGVLERAFVEEPLWVDFSWARGLDEPAIRHHARFPDEVATVASALHDRTKSDLFGEDLRQHRRQMRLARIAVVSLLVFLVAALSFWWLSIRTGDRLAASLKTATSRQFAALSVLRLPSQPVLSLLEAVVAARADDTFEARDSLFKAIRDRPRLSSYLHTERGEAACVAYSPDGKTIAAGCRGAVVLFDSASRRRLAEAPLATGRGDVRSVAFSLDGKVLAAVYRVPTGDTPDPLRDKGRLEVWDAASLERRTKVPIEMGECEVASVALSPDGKLIAAGFTAHAVTITYGCAGVWDVASLESLKDGGIILGQGRVSSLAFNLDGETIVVGGEESRYKVVAPGEGYPGTGALEFHESWVKSLTVKPGGETSTADRLSLDEAKLVVKEGDVTSVAFSRDGKILAAGHQGAVDASQGGVVVWDAIGRRRLEGEPLAVTEGLVTSVALSPDGRVIVAGYNVGGSGGVVAWDLASRKRLTGPPIVVKEGDLTGVDLAPDGKSVAVGSAGLHGGVAVFDLAARNPFARRRLPVEKGGVREVAFRPDGKTIAAAYQGEGGGGVVAWDLARLERVAEYPLAVEGGEVSSVAFGRDDRPIGAGWVGSQGVGGVVVRDEAGRDRLAELPPSLKGLHVTSGVALSRDGKTVAAGFSLPGDFDADGSRMKPSTELFPPPPAASGDTDGVVMVWDSAGRSRLAAGPLSLKEGYVTSVALSPDGRTLAAGYGVLAVAGKGGEGGVVVWDVAGRSRLIEDRFTAKQGKALALAFGADGKTLAVGYHAGVVVWDVAGRKRLPGVPFNEEDGDIARLAFSPDGKSVAATCKGNRSGEVVWDLVRRKWLMDATFLLDAYVSAECLAFSPDGKSLAAGYQFGDVVLWDVDLKTWQRIAGRIANRNLRWDEWQQDFPDEPYRRTFRDLPWPATLPAEVRKQAERWEAENAAQEEELTIN